MAIAKSILAKSGFAKDAFGMNVSRPFIGRKSQLAKLEQAYRSSTGMMAVVFGRRRIGKTELLRQFVRDKRAIFFTGKESPRQILIDDFLEQTALCFGRKVAGPGEVTSWKAALRLAVGAWRGPGRLLLVFDEVQWAAGERASPELISTLQEFWDHEWQNQPLVGLILCSSFVGFIEKLRGSKSPLFSRATLEMQLNPFTPAEAREFHPHYSLLHQTQAYFICGGVPLYHRAFSPRQSFQQNLTENFLSSTSPLYREGDHLLRAEFKELPSYFAILTTLAEHRRRHKELLDQTQLSDAHYYLHRLMLIGYIRRVAPLAARVSRKEVYYEIQDPFLRFWFRFLFKHLSALELLGPERAFERIVGPELESFFASCFEGFCRDRLKAIYVTKENVTCPFEVGEYWKTGAVQIDVVGIRKDGWVDLGECKWGRVRSLDGVLSELEQKIARYPLSRDYSVGRRIFLRHKPAKAAPLPAKIHTLEEMFGLEE